MKPKYTTDEQGKPIKCNCDNCYFGVDINAKEDD